MYMFVYLLLSFSSRFVSSSANETPLVRVDREISARHFGTPQYLGLPYGPPITKWNTLLPEGAIQRQQPGGIEFESRRNPNLEISKSIELIFDPNVRALTPVNQVPSTNRTEGPDGTKSSLALLTPYTQKRLSKVIEKYDKEAKGDGTTDVKNYQTGRFKLYHLKRPRFRV